MSQVQFTANFHVAGVANPLVVTPSAQDFNLTVGTPADGTAAAVVSGGQAPYSYALDAASGALPDGVSFVEDGAGNISLAGTPTTAGDSLAVVLNVTDAAGAQARLTTRIGARK